MRLVDQEDDLRNVNQQLGKIEQLRLSNVTRQIQEAGTKAIDKTSEVMMNKNKENRNVGLEYLRKRKLQRVKTKVKIKEM